MYFSVSAAPGYNNSRLNKHGFTGEFALFHGSETFQNETTLVMDWRSENASIKGLKLC